MKAAIVGVGRMGKAIAWAMDKLGCTELVLVDSVMDNLSTCAEGVSCSTTSVHALLDGNYPFLENSDIVISALPYHQNEKLARYCIDHKLPYCDLGGHVDTSNNINEYAKEKGSFVMTDLGLAPGWVNILAEHGYNSHKGLPTTVEMMVGGLPTTPNNYLKYNCTWSHDGLINEYKDQCTVLTDGSITLADSMSGLINVNTGLGAMEAFYTSGGASHTIKTMQGRGVQNCHYRTIRYKGHCEAMKFLMRNISSDNELLAFLDKACPPAPDLVIVKVRVGDREPSLSYKHSKWRQHFLKPYSHPITQENVADWEEEKIVYSNDKFSAMQMATAFPISVVAYLIGTPMYGRFFEYKSGSKNTTETNGPLSYQHIPYRTFADKLNFLFEEAQ